MAHICVYTNTHVVVNSLSTVEKNIFSEQLQLIIQENLSQDYLDNTFLARRLCLSEAQLYRKVKKEFSCSPNVLIRNTRLKTARRLMCAGQYSVQEIAYQVGFSHVGYFIRRFEERFGKSPGELRKQLIA